MNKIKINIDKSNNYTETHVDIRCPQNDKKADALISAIKLFENNILVKKDGEEKVLNLNHVFYFEYVDRKTYCYAKKDVYETKYKLYEVESICANTTFTRVSKNMVVDILKIKSFKSQINGRLKATLINNEIIEISRNYAKTVRNKFEVIISEKNTK